MASIKLELIGLRTPEEVVDGCQALYEGHFTPGPGMTVSLYRFYDDPTQAIQALEFINRHDKQRKEAHEADAGRDAQV